MLIYQNAADEPELRTLAGRLRDMGWCMNALKEKFPGQMDFGKASGIVKTMLK